MASERSGDLAAGDFSTWMTGMHAALRGDASSDVPCGTCTACCTSSQFIHIGPDESDTLARIPAELLFSAPGLPRGHVLLGYDERGHCPMFVDGHCSIYEDRPRTCRTYDCRIFPAAGIEPDEDKVLIAERARRWQFSHPTPDDDTRHCAVRATAAFADARDAHLPDDVAPHNATQRAVFAIEMHDLFLSRDSCGRSVVVDPDPGEVVVEVRRRRSSRRS